VSEIEKLHYNFHLKETFYFEQENGNLTVIPVTFTLTLANEFKQVCLLH